MYIEQNLITDKLSLQMWKTSSYNGAQLSNNHKDLPINTTISLSHPQKPLSKKTNSLNAGERERAIDGG